MRSEIASADIDLAALQHNLERVRELAPGHPVMAVVKANAYGHILDQVLGALGDADALAVARVDEAAAARASGWHGGIVVLEGALSAADLAEAGRLDLQLVFHDPSQLELIEHHGTRLATAWLKMDSGMNRLGFAARDFPQALHRLERCGVIAEPPRLMTHLACADRPGDRSTQVQLDEFARCTGDSRRELSIANSAGIIAWPDSRRGWLRPGIMLYGISPFPDSSAADHGLRAVMHFRTRLIARKRIDKGQRVGYGGTWRAPADTWIGTAAVGYGDGYPGNLPSGTEVLVNGQRVSLAGRVSMDMITLDLGDKPARVGDEVVLWGRGLPVERIAAASGRLAYELVCGVSRRVPRCVNP